MRALERERLLMDSRGGVDEPVVTGKSGEANSRHEEHRDAVPALNVRVTFPVAAAAVPPATPVRRPLDTDLELIVAAQRGEQLAADQFVRRFLPVVYAVSRQFFMTGGSMDDIVSEGLHGLWKGVRSFDSDKLGKATVGTYVALCVRRQIVTAVVGALRFKHDPLNRARTWDVPTDDGDPLPILESFPDTGLPVVEQLEQSATLRALVAGIGALTELERRALVGVVFEGRSYAEIEGIARSRDSKQIDNAYQRAVKKLRARVLLPPTRLQLA